MIRGPDNLRLKSKQDMRFSGKKIHMNLHKKFDIYVGVSVNLDEEELSCIPSWLVN